MFEVGFWIFTLLALGSAVVVITHRSAVISALALAFNLISIAGFFFLLSAQFIGFLQIIVYAGAIMVLILFVIMLLNVQDQLALQGGGRFQRWFGPILVLVMSITLAWGVSRTPGEFPEPSADFGTVESVGVELFGRFFYPFEAISLLLVVAMIGAVLLGKKRL